MRENKRHQSQTVSAASMSNTRDLSSGIRVTRVPSRPQSLINQVIFLNNLYNNLHKSSN
jgi:hypothetical protein